MDNSFVFNETTLKRIPQFFILAIILLLGLPYICLILGIDFTALANSSYGSHLSQSQIRGYFRQVLLQWSGFSIAVMTVLLAFTQYRLTKDKIALIIGLSVLFSGSLEALHIWVIDGISLSVTEKDNIDALLWIFANSIGGLILLIGLTLLLNNKKEHALRLTTFILLTIFLVSISATLIYYVAGRLEFPVVLSKYFKISRPYEFMSVAIYLVLMLWTYPKTYKVFPSILAHCIFYIALTQIVISVYLMGLSTSAYDSAYNIAYFLKVVAYFIPFSCLIINYIFSYSEVLKAQKKLKIKQEELKYMATHDPLTNLYNRREFEVLLEKAIANSTRTTNSLALLIIDLDDFKKVNDTFGHVHGDELLKQFSSRINLLIRAGDILSRVGGDEFTVIAPNLKSTSSARRVAEKILEEITTPYPINGKLITLTASIGIAVFPEDGDDTEELLRKADIAMYKAKNAGKSAYQFYTDQLSSHQHRESEVEVHLKKALQNDEFELYFQPQYNLINQEIVGAELFLRWHNDELGAVSPNEFIPFAESTGLIIDIGYWILRKACEQIMEWTNQYNKMLSFTINISPQQFMDNRFIPNLQQLITDYHYPAQYLELEITESLLIDNIATIASSLNQVSSLGIKLSLDDFGMNYCSLNQLKTLPINTLKIDKSFIADIHNEYEKVAIVDVIIKLAEELGMTSTAEGIETHQQLNYLVSKKCYLGQGVLLSKPVPAEEFVQLAYVKDQKKKIHRIK